MRAWVAVAVTAAVASAVTATATVLLDGDTDPVGATAPDRIIAGPQGDRGQFVVECELSHIEADDPILHPGMAGHSHLHQFFGAAGVTASSGLSDLLAAETTCDQKLDTASYWAPLLVTANGDVVSAARMVAYYRAGPGVDPERVVAPPAGLQVVAGRADATIDDPQPQTVVSWSCGDGVARQVHPPDCRGIGDLRLNVVFPDCWDGLNVVPLPIGRHVVYSTAGECPASHPVYITQVTLAFDHPAVDPEGLALSSGSIFGGHADFWNAWDQQKLERETRQCINRNLACRLAGARAP